MRDGTNTVVRNRLITDVSGNMTTALTCLGLRYVCMNVPRISHHLLYNPKYYCVSDYMINLCLISSVKQWSHKGICIEMLCGAEVIIYCSNNEVS